MEKVEFAVIGGSGLYNMTGLTDVAERWLDTPFGKPSDAVIVGKLHGRTLAFLPRHGRGHIYNPSEVPYRANIYALKTLGVKYIVSVSACGSLREDYQPGHIVVPDQLFDFTKGKRPSTFFENGIVAHVGVANPFSPELSSVITQAVRAANGTVHEGGTFITIEGPRFSTKGESNTYRQWGMSIIGMTTATEAVLAAEAEIAYAVMAHVTDYDVWHESEEPVSTEAVIRILRQNTTLAQEAISWMAANFDHWANEWPAHNGLNGSFLIDPAKISPEVKHRLAPILSKYM
ncbi:MAG: S-methyl-5'-thioadenosine phosphorylase [Candidatus Promineifilaceae bacterium]